MTTPIVVRSNAVRQVVRFGGWLRFRSNQTTSGGREPLLVRGVASRAASIVPVYFGPAGPAAQVGIKVISAEGADDSGAAGAVLPG